ncbi:ABC transporter permease [Legionella spiritensis]|uniref:ABC transporter permease n=1 Tax=Legionella spiritensis TaxID=452 RepID=UPI000F6DC0AC|nr:ABC transporter permease [Legionella spiritensis]VEG89661.1 polysaccharide ABC transporter, permease protein [Legionella spiritensis]
MNIVKKIIEPYLSILKHHELLKCSILSDISKKYAGSAIGMFWVVLYPLILFFIYSALYLVIFRVKPLDMTTNTYLVYIMSGLLPFLGFAEGLSAGTTSLSSKKSLLLNTVYPSEYIPLQTVISNYLTLFVGIFLLIAANLLMLRTLNVTILFVPVLIVLQLMFTIGIVWVLSILNLVLKDIQQSLSFITMLLMIMSPIAYTPAMVPSSLKLIIYLNPFSYYVWSYQDLFVRGVISHHMLIAALLSVTVFTLGYIFYDRTKKVFYEFA